ncbi:MAG TPA: hypothetical protein VF201_03355 [Nitrolancea sp.]
MFRRLLALLFVAFLLAIPFSASADTTGTISGTVTNGTPGGGSVAGLPVTLYEYQGMNIVKQYTGTTDDSGKYVFKDVPVLDGEGYVAHVTYSNVDFPGSLLLMPQDAGKVDAIKVYEPSTDASIISLDSRSIVVNGADAGSRLLSLFEILAISNKSDRAYIGNDGVVLRLGLPDGAAQITPQPGFDFGNAKIENGTLITTGPISPGDQTALIAYSLPYTGTSKTVTIGTAMPTQNERFLVKDGTYDISSQVFNDAGLVDVSGDKYHVLSVDKPIVGDTLSVDILGLPKAGNSGESSNGPLYAAIGAGVLIIVAGALVFFVLRRRSHKVALAGAEGGVAAGIDGRFDDERLALATQLNQLDERRAAGTIDDVEYQNSRQQVMQDLRTIMLKRRGLDDPDA